MSKLRIYQPEFYSKNTVEVARELLGTFLIHETEEGVTVGKIVETEAYLCSKDPACHAANGMTNRNEPMFGPPGTVYVYQIYGIYMCFNAVTNREGVGEAVLIRALEPVDGITLMQKRRGKTTLKDLCSGPAKLVIAMGITMDLNGTSLYTGPLKIGYEGGKNFGIHTTTRIGISEGAELPLRFYMEGNSYISKK